MVHKWGESVLKLYYYTKREGFITLIRRCVKTLFPVEATYERWKRRHRLTDREYYRQQKESAGWNLHIDILLDRQKDYPLFEKSLKHQSANIASVIYDIGEGSGKFILLPGSDISLSRDALYEFGCWQQAHPLSDVCYCDHDIEGRQPFFKPDFNFYYLLSCPYMGELILVRRSVLQKLLLKDPEIINREIYGIQLALTDITDQIGHIPQILYHSEKHLSVSDETAFTRKQLESFLQRQPENWSVKNGLADGTFDVRCRLREHPLVSVIIPNRNHREDLEKCLESLKRQSYAEYEILIVENNSDAPDIFDYYQRLKRSDDRIRILKWNKPFNYSAVNNYAVSHAQGEYLLFLNNDVEFIEPSSVERMAELCCGRDTGAVGIKLLYPDGTIQHAGVVIGYGGIAGHAFLGYDHRSHGYMNRLDCVQEYSAVTAACMMVKRKAFEQCGGFDPDFQIAFNDIDLCLRMGKAGYKIVYTPYATAWHYESKSRGREDTIRKMQRFNREVSLFCKRWRKLIRQGDPAYNPNLSLDKWDFSIKV